MILALDAATSTVVLGLAAPDGRILSERRLSGGRGDVLPGLLTECLDQIGARASDIDEVVCGVGPGSFTGIRIALSFGHGLAFRRKLPYRGVSSLAVALCSPDLDRNRPALALLDALRGEAYLREGREASDVRRPLDELPVWPVGTQVVAEGRPDFLARLPGEWSALSEKISVAGLLAARAVATEPVPNYLRASAPEEMRAGR